MSLSPTDSKYLRFDPPFYLPAALESAGLKEASLPVAAFDNDRVAASMVAALRLSLEAAIQMDEQQDI